MKSAVDIEVSLEAARVAFEDGKIDEGDRVLATLLKEDVENVSVRHMAGYAAFLRSDYALALTHLEVAVHKDPLFLDARILYAFVLSELNRPGDAIRAFYRVLALDPRCEPARVRLCELLHEQGRYEVAIRVFDEGCEFGMSPAMREALAALLGVVVTVGSLESAASVETAGPPPMTITEFIEMDPEEEPERKRLVKTWVQAKKLLHPQRLDMVAKILFARELLGQPSKNSGISAKELYRKHIFCRTGGVEPGSETRKASLQDYEREFSALLHSMKANGFDPEHSIPVAQQNGIVMNGAHRVAAAIALGIEKVPVEYHEDASGLHWGFDWFVENGFAPDEIDELLRSWVELQQDRAGCVVLWPAAEERWEAIEKSVTERFPLVARRDFEFSRSQFDEVVRDVYASDWGPIVGDNIEAKIRFFSDCTPKLRVLVVHAPQSVTKLAELKKHVREEHHEVVPSDRFATLHTTDSVYETQLVADIFLNGANLRALRCRPETGTRDAFMDWLRDYHKVLGELGISSEDCCVVGSSSLEVLGVRDSTDIDFTMTGAVRSERYTPGVTHINKDLDVVSKNYPRAIARDAAPTDDQLVGDRALYFRFRGLKFAALDVVVTRKLTQRRDKDLADVAKVGQLRLAGRL